MSQTARPEVNEEACIVCGRCVEACSFEVLKLRKNGPMARGVGECIVCGQCVAVCPRNAMSHPAIPEQRIEEIPAEPAVEYDRLVSLLRQRRSVRRYTDEEVPDELICELIDAAVLAPSGHNEQSWAFTVIKDPAELDVVRNAAAEFYAGLLAALEDGEKRAQMIDAMGEEAVAGLDGIAPAVRLILRAHERGSDRMIWGAPTLLLAYAPEQDPTGAESTHYAVANLMLAAVTKGLGSCSIGFLTIPAGFDADLRRALHVPDGQALHASLALGWPDVTYHRSTGRREPAVRII
ncbi:MAG: nitroreductase family protein [Armatimonadota bacterium]|jgi:nitroreductase/NAD-dependent dihydropyrimidine dehydrogenase PreA subunit